jgi:hypothetical protein
VTDEELLRNGVTSRRYLKHFKKLSRKVQQASKCVLGHAVVAPRKEEENIQHGSRNIQDGLGNIQDG